MYGVVVLLMLWQFRMPIVLPDMLVLVLVGMLLCLLVLLLVVHLSMICMPSFFVVLVVVI